MNRMLIGSLATVAVFALTSFALTRPATTGAWTVSQYQLDRAFRQQIVISPNQPQTLPVPVAGGFVITQVRLTTLTGQFPNLTVAVNGAAESMSYLGNSTAESLHDLNPPIVARPGDTVTVSVNPNNGPQTVVLAGYTTLPGET